MSIVKEWNSGNALGKNCLWSDNLGPDFQQASFADKPQEAERLLTRHLGKPVQVERIQDIRSRAFGNISLFSFTVKEQEPQP